VLRSVEEKHPKTERAGKFSKFLLLLRGKFVNQSAGALSGESGVPKKRRAICVLENGPDATVNVDVLKPTPIKVPTLGRIGIFQEFRRKEFLCG